MCTKNSVFGLSAETGPLLLKDWVKILLEDYAAPVCKPSAVASLADNLLKHVVPTLGDVPLEQITPAMLQRCLNQEAAHGNLRNGGPLSPKSVRNIRTALSTCFTVAVSQGLLSANPVAGTIVRRAPKPTVETMEDSEAEILVNFLYTDDNLMNAPILFAAKTGVRRGEVAALRWTDYDPQRGYLHINHTVKRLPTNRPEGPKTELVFGPAKTESSNRNLALPPELSVLLEAQYTRFKQLFGREPMDEDFIFFSATGGIIDPDNLTHYFADVLSALHLKHVKFHALRHTFATRAVEQGIDIETVSGLLGHTDVTTTTHYYLHPRQEAMNQALWKLSSAEGTPPRTLPVNHQGAKKQHKHTRRSTFTGLTKGGAAECQSL